MKGGRWKGKPPRGQGIKAAGEPVARASTSLDENDKLRYAPGPGTTIPGDFATDKFFLKGTGIRASLRPCLQKTARSPSGKAELCKSSIVSSILTRASKFLRIENRALLARPGFFATALAQPGRLKQ